uniref:Uncharacterized protein n=1 Tax=Vespula pensylvanica TaxID=30213 RepID=A0A834UAJ7_VESPE|nr:hypothetical protein H0235_008256 [Vespula pensylvanica]
MVEEGRAEEEEEEGEEECKETRNYLGKEDIESHAQWPRDIRAERFERDVKRMTTSLIGLAINLGESRHHQERTSRNEKNFRCVILSTDTLCVNVARAKAKSRSKKRKTEKSREEERKKVNDVDAATTTFRFPENDDEQSNGFARAAISEVLETSFPHFRWISKVARPKKRMKLCSLRTWYNPLGRAMKY